MDDDQRLAQKLAAILPHLNEAQRRILLAAEAQALGRGGIPRVARAAGVLRHDSCRAPRAGSASGDAGAAERWRAQENAGPRPHARGGLGGARQSRYARRPDVAPALDLQEYPPTRSRPARAWPPGERTDRAGAVARGAL